MDRPADIVTLRNDLDGRVIAPGDASYDEARAVFYGGCDRRPSAVVRAANADDVARVITFARERGTELAIRSGGHSGAGHITTDGGIVLDLADMRALEIDVEGQTAWVEPGLTAGAFTAAVSDHGLASDPRGVPRPDMGSARDDQGSLRSDQPVPAQSEHPTGARLKGHTT